MKKFVLLGVISFLLSLSVAAQNPKTSPTPPNNDEEIVKISTDLIQLDVIVTDKKGKIITDLTPNDFEIYENGKKQNITNFLFVASQTQSKIAPSVKNNKKNDKTSMPIPPVELKPEQVKRTIALIVDDLSLSFESLVKVRSALKTFVDEQMQPNDLVAIIVAGNGAGSLQQFTSDKRMLHAAIDKIRWNPQGRAGITPFAPAGQISLTDQGSDENSEDSNSSTSDQSGIIQEQIYSNNYWRDIFSVGTLGAINYVVKGMTNISGRKSVMLFSDGFPVCMAESTSGEMDAESCKTMTDALRRLTDFCNRSSVSIYTMDARGLQTTALSAADATASSGLADVVQLSGNRSQQLISNQEGLKFLADETGGKTYFNQNFLDLGIESVLEDQKGYYLLAYQPDSDSFDRKTLRFNKLDIKVKNPDYVVRSRKGFLGFVGNDSPENLQNPTDKTFNALMSPFSAGEIGLRLNTLFGNNSTTGSFVNSYLHINAKDLTFEPQEDGSKKVAFEIMAASFGENGATIDQVGRTYRLNVPADTYEEMIRDGFVYSFIFPVKKAGAFQMRVAVRDTTSSKVGSANQFVEAPDLKKGNLTLSGIILENFRDGEEEQPSLTVNDITLGKGDPRVDTSLRKFQQRTFLRYVSEIYNAKLDKSQKAQIQSQIKVFKDGKAVLEIPVKPFETEGQKDMQRITFGGKIALGKELAPGEYILQIIVKDMLAKEKNNLTTQWVQFEIVN